MNTYEPGTVVVNFGSEAGLRHVSRFLVEIQGWIRRGVVDNIHGGTAELDTILDAISATLPPPRIAEPGLWGVVSAHPQVKVGGPVIFMRDVDHADSAWRSVADGSAWEWDQLVDPILVRDGIDGGAL